MLDQRTFLHHRFALPLALLLSFAGPAHAVDGVIEINQARALAGGVVDGDEPAFPVQITAPGSYVLTSDLSPAAVDQVEHAIDIRADDVTIDLNGFRITGTVNSAIWDQSLNHRNVTVRNGTISDVAAGGGIDLRGEGSRAERVRIGGSVPAVGIGMGDGCQVSDNSVIGGFGIDVGDSCVVSRNVVLRAAIQAGSNNTIVENTVTGASQWGIFAAASTIIGNTITGAQDAGIRTDDSTLIGNTISDSGSFGLSSSAQVTLGHNRFWNNNGGNANPQIQGPFVEVGGNQCGTDATCP